MADNVFTDIKTVNEILFGEPLTVPNYQRPYKWTEKNVNQLIDDLLLFSDKDSYRIGTIVIHHDGNILNIVDGQQRIFTLSLIASELLRTDLGARISGRKTDDLSLASLTIDNDISIINLQQNLLLIRSRIKEFHREQIEFLFNKCDFVYIELIEISEAFQFFDSQNSRGRELAPHDLLKAFHLREMTTLSEADKIKCVTYWEDISEILPNIFSNYLFKIRRWSKGQKASVFTKDNLSVFKGISVDEKQTYNFEKSYRINHFFTDQYNVDVTRKIDGLQTNFPFQVGQVILNGKRFFEYIYHYAELVKYIENSHDIRSFKDSITNIFPKHDSMARSIYTLLSTYKNRYRQGDVYVRNLFDCATLYYLDKFGTVNIEEAIIKFFVWAYRIRLEQQSVYFETTDRSATSSEGMIRIIREATHTREILHKHLDSIQFVGQDKSVKGIEEIYKLMEKLHSFKN